MCITSLQELKDESNVIDYGAIILCKGGTASMRIDFKDWHLKQYAVITLFPNDVVMLHDVSDDFEVEMLRYDKTLLREASLQLEQTVYSLLRKDRCRTDKQVVTLIIENMFSLLRLYFIQKECMCLDQLVLYQLKAFFSDSTTGWCATDTKLLRTTDQDAPTNCSICLWKISNRTT